MGNDGSHSAIIQHLFASRSMGLTLPYFVRNMSKKSLKFVCTRPIKFLSVNFLYSDWITARNIARRASFMLLMFSFSAFCVCKIILVCSLYAGFIFAVSVDVSGVGRGGTYDVTV